MDHDVREDLRELLTRERVLTAAVVVDDEPMAALLPYAPATTFDRLYVQASALARHSKGLTDGATIGVLVHAPATMDRDPMQVPRLSVSASVSALGQGSAAWAEAADQLVSRFPAMATTLALGDFTVYALTLGRGRYVEGFARAFNVGPDLFRELAERRTA